MNDNLLNETLDDLAAESGELDLGSFDGFDPFAESEQSEAPVAECDPPITESLEDNVTPLPQKNEGSIWWWGGWTATSPRWEPGSPVTAALSPFRCPRSSPHCPWIFPATGPILSTPGGGRWPE